MSQVTAALERCRAEHGVEVERLLAEEAAAWAPEGSLLTEMCGYHLATGGKRLRALVPLLTAEALGADPVPLRPFAAACEMLHNATLVHDDLQDGDTTRRGRPTVWKRWSAAQAVNLGDAMFYWAVALLGRLEVPEARRWEAIELLVRGTLRVIDGQVREFQLKDDPAPGMSGYVRMIEGKTSGLFEIPLVGAARLVGAAPEAATALGEAARDLGVLFQIQDDLLDLYGDKGRERRGTDVAEGKISALVVHALGCAGAADAQRLREVLTKAREQTSDDEIDWADRLFRRCGSVRFALDEIARRERAVAGRPELAATPRLRELLVGLGDAFLEPIRPVMREFART
ncbi:MAG: polyprenyl synthetase family protein [Deltaproteobacteria bacterium]|nr:polyprenyl synthetase family protein [Deltaproteobacteria bacterium]